MIKDFCSPQCMKMDTHYYIQISEADVNWSRNFIEMNVILRTKRTREIPLLLFKLLYFKSFSNHKAD